MSMETLEQLSRRLHVGPRTLGSCAKRGELPGAIMVGGRWRVKSRIIDRWMLTVKKAIEYREPSSLPTREEISKWLDAPPKTELEREIKVKLKKRMAREEARLPRGR